MPKKEIKNIYPLKIYKKIKKNKINKKYKLIKPKEPQSIIPSN